MIHSNGSPDDSLKHARRKVAALQRSWRALCEQYQREGRKLVVWRNNRVEHADPAELLAEADAAKRDD